MIQPTLFQYKPLYKPGQLTCGTGQIAVITGWTIKSAIASQLNPEEYAVIGQLYSATRGLNFLFRNLIYNPHVRYLVAINATKHDEIAGGQRCLLDFFENGFEKGISDTGKECWVVRSEVPGYIDVEVDATALRWLRLSVECMEAKSIKEAIALAQDHARIPKEPWGKPEEFDLIEPECSIFPGRRYGHRVEGKTIADTWVKMIHLIKSTGAVRPSAYDSDWQELIDLVAVVTDEPKDFYFPEPNYLPCDRAFLQEYISQMLDDAPQQEGVKYTYGSRMRSHFGTDQIKFAINKLSEDPSSARVVISLWDAKEDTNSSNPPCLNHIWVRVVNDELSLTATFRSNDIFSAWPANAMGLRALQLHIRDAIQDQGGRSLKMGPLITFSQSAHIYSDAWDSAKKVIDSHYTRIHNETRTFSDASGSFVISVQESCILVEHMTSGAGEVVGTFRGKNAKILYQAIAATCPALETEHAIYIGTELQKAETAFSFPEFLFEQDKPITKK